MTDLTNSRYVTLGQTAASFSADPDVQFRQVHGLTVCKNFTKFTFPKFFFIILVKCTLHITCTFNDYITN